jgi:hypothetical protein
MTVSPREDLKALYRLINQADLVLATIPDPHPSIPSARESLNAALALSKGLVARTAEPISESVTGSVAAALGAKGGTKTAERGSEYFKRIAGMRKTKAGGRPKKAE